MNPPISPTVAKRSALRWLFPLGILVIATGVLYVTWTWADSQADLSTLNMIKMLTVMIAGLLLFIWGLRYSGIPKRHVLLGTLLVFGGAMSVGKIHSMDGHFFPIFAWRDWVLNLFFDGSHDRQLNKELQDRPKADVPGMLEIKPGDWPEYRGPKRDGIVTGIKLKEPWDYAPKLVWRQLIGGGYSSFVAANGFLVTMEQRPDDKTGEQREWVVCYQATTGRIVWEHSWPGIFQEQLGGDGPRATPTIANGDVYALGARGRLVCLAGETGNEKWGVETLEGNKNIQWAMSGSPLVVDDLVIVNPGAQTEEQKGQAVRAYDRKTGQLKWAAGNHPAGYASPQLAELDGVRQVLIFDGHGLAGHDLASGSQLWRFAWPTMQGINVAQPLVLDRTRLVISSGYNVGGALLDIKRDGTEWKVTEVWRTKSSVMRSKFCTPVVQGDYAYGLNDGFLECVDLKTGKQLWKDDRKPKKGEGYGHGQLLLVDEHLLVLTEFGELVLVKYSTERFFEVGRFDALKRGKKTWCNPTIVGNTVYVRNEEEMAAIQLPTRK